MTARRSPTSRSRTGSKRRPARSSSTTTSPAFPCPPSSVLALAGFVPAASVDPALFHHFYYAEPLGPGADKPYTLLAAALTRSDRVGVSKSPSTCASAQ
ncbi:hypothetical protein GO001_34570 [Streptomyces sp. NRRL B-1677]|uniref:Ku protein n=1 Tax=Streptomyces sp. NRRL B-1677 TaxID=2682966 RepID=UPI001892CAAC|nr:Ku protein [Streptomyces sp. NRRL B-1677]MBF6050238.1 hypothetical protein [Streptomyces sp. NRRL B-1677]